MNSTASAALMGKEGNWPHGGDAKAVGSSFWACLEQAPLFRNMSLEAKRDLTMRLSSRFHSRGSYIMSQGDVGAELYVIRKGKVKLMRCADPDRLFVVALLEPGEIFGLAAAVDGSRRAFTAMALKDTELYVLHREQLLKHIRRFPETAILLMQEMSDRLRLQAETMENLALKNVSVRIVRTLVHLAGRKALMDDTGLVIRRAPTQQDLACMVGACRETISRMMAGFFREGLAERRGRAVVLKYELLNQCGLAKAARPAPADRKAEATPVRDRLRKVA